MKNIWLKKGLVCGIIVLFVGTSVLLSISGYLGEITKRDSNSLNQISYKKTNFNNDLNSPKTLGLTDGLVGYWNFDEGSGAIAHDYSGNGNDGAIHGAQWTTGVSDGGLNFDGDDDYVNCGNSQTLNITNNITICAWIKCDVLKNNYQAIVGKWCSPSSHSYVFYLENVWGWPYWCEVFSVSNNSSIYVTFNLEVGKWYFLTVAYNEQGNFYEAGLNGVWMGGSAGGGGGISQSNEPLYIGGDTESEPRYFDGIIDEVRVYDRTLNDTEIQTLYEDFKNQPPIASFAYAPSNPTNRDVIQLNDTSTTDPDAIKVSWWWDFGDGYFSQLQNPVHCYYADGNYHVILTVTDNNGLKNSTQKTITVYTPLNNPPNKPSTPSGQTNGNIGQEYSYTTSTTDPDGDQVYYLWDWGDGNNSGWLGPYNSGLTCGAKHIWNVKDNYNIKVKAKDIYGNESNWSDPLPITMPYSFNKPILQFLELLFQRFPYAFPILRQLLRY